jgi:predicted transcriptional regulator
MARCREQITVALPVELRRFVDRIAEREDRSASGVIRHFVAEAARRAPSESKQQEAA